MYFLIYIKSNTIITYNHKFLILRYDVCNSWIIWFEKDMQFKKTKKKTKKKKEEKKKRVLNYRSIKD